MRIRHLVLFLPFTLLSCSCTRLCVAAYAVNTDAANVADATGTTGAADAVHTTDPHGKTSTASQSTSKDSQADSSDTLDTSDTLDSSDNNSDLQTPYKYVGNRYSHKFHLPDCPFAQAMSKWNTEYFRSRKEAIEHGEKPCHWCLPPWWKSVSATIVGSSNNPSNVSNTSNGSSKN